MTGRWIKFKLPSFLMGISYMRITKWTWGEVKKDFWELKHENIEWKHENSCFDFSSQCRSSNGSVVTAAGQNLWKGRNREKPKEGTWQLVGKGPRLRKRVCQEEVLRAKALPTLNCPAYHSGPEFTNWVITNRSNGVWFQKWLLSTDSLTKTHIMEYCYY